MKGQAYIIFEIGGQRYEYDGGVPNELAERFEQLFNGYPEELGNRGADRLDELPTARWEIALLGGSVILIMGARDNGAIHPTDWKRPRVY